MNIPWLTVVLALPLGASLLLQLIPRSAVSALKAFTIAATLATAVLVWVLVATMSGSAVSRARWASTTRRSTAGSRRSARATTSVWMGSRRGSSRSTPASSFSAR